MVFDKIKKGFSSAFGSQDPTLEEDYIEIDLGREVKRSKVIVRPFVLKSFEDVTPILNVLREGYTIAVIDIKQLRSKDLIELKRAISKIKKTADALEGTIAGFGENVIIVTPQFAEIYKPRSAGTRVVSADDVIKDDVIREG
jgi:SepF-like predicted cell division protein (DUF552 family)